MSDQQSRLERFVRRGIPAIFLVGVGSVLFPSAGRDDSHITYWSAYSLSHFGEILNFNGDRIEQSSSLLHVLLLALAHAASGIDLVIIGRVFSVLCAVATLLAVHRLGEKVHPGDGFASALLCAGSVFFSYWAFAGLESSLASLTVVFLILAWSGYASEPSRGSLASAVLATWLLALVRPEMPIVIACMLAGSAALVQLRSLRASPNSEREESENRRTLGRLGVLAGVSVAVCSLLFAFRLAYFDSLFPQPVTAKAADFAFERLAGGFLYLITGTHPAQANPVPGSLLTIALILISVAGAMRAAWDQLLGEHVNHHTLLSAVFIAAYFSFIILVDGDWMEGGRITSHAVPVVAVFVAYALRTFLASSRARNIAVCFVFASQGVMLLQFTSVRSVGMPLWTSLNQYESYALDFNAEAYSYFDRTNRDHLRNIPTLYQTDRIVEALLKGEREKIHIMAHQMGVLPFHLVKKYFGRIVLFDVNGLTDRVATETPVFAKLTRSNYGVSGAMAHFLKNRGTLRQSPEFTVPDVIIYQFYQEDPPSDAFVQAGYKVVYVQTGDVPTGSATFPGQRVVANQLIAVRRELVSELPLLLPRKLDIRDSGIVSAASGE